MAAACRLQRLAIKRLFVCRQRFNFREEILEMVLRIEHGQVAMATWSHMHMAPYSMEEFVRIDLVGCRHQLSSPLLQRFHVLSNSTSNNVLQIVGIPFGVEVTHRFSSTGGLTDNSTDSATTTITPYIPEPPAVPTIESTTLGDVTDALGEPSFASLGLGGWSPVGIVQNFLEFLHINLDLPWFMAIAVGTIIIKIVLFPLVIYGQRNSAITNNNMPEMQRLQLKMSEARKSGDRMEASKWANELVIFMREKEMNPLKGLLVPLMQAPIFISFFIGIRRICTLPVESMTYGGLYWFTNLTIPDPLYLLPIITSATLFIIMELGIESGIRADNMQLMRYALRAMPIILIPFMINFPAGVLCYWLTSNLFSLCQVGILRIPEVRDYFGIERLIKHPPMKTPITSMSFMESVKDTWTNSKITNELDAREQIDEMRFRKAGMGPVKKTYRYDPTKQKQVTSANMKERSDTHSLSAKPTDRS